MDQPIQVTDTYLEPGTYVFKLANSSSDRHIVYIFNADENHLINTVMAIPNYRVQLTGNTRFTSSGHDEPQPFALHSDVRVSLDVSVRAFERQLLRAGKTEINKSLSSTTTTVQ